jgi:branched-subunit amino acid ABC-type transport system permease component
LNLLLQSIGFGLVTASILALAAVGVSLQFGVTNYINFAYGDFLTLGAYLAWLAYVPLHLNFFVGSALAILTLGGISMLVARFVMQPFIRRQTPVLFLLIVTFGISLIVSNGLQGVFGANFQTFNLPSQQDIQIGPFVLTGNQLGIIAIAVGVMFAVHMLLTRTKFGKAMRAMSDDRDLARISGVDTERIAIWTWFVSGCLAGLAGIVYAMNVVLFEPFVGQSFLFVIFSAVILGGIGQPYGAMLGALIIGLATEMSAAVINSSYKSTAAFLILIVVLLLRPQGIIPSRPRGTAAWRQA